MFASIDDVVATIIFKFSTFCLYYEFYCDKGVYRKCKTVNTINRAIILLISLLMLKRIFVPVINTINSIELNQFLTFMLLQPKITQPYHESAKFKGTAH